MTNAKQQQREIIILQSFEGPAFHPLSSPVCCSYLVKVDKRWCPNQTLKSATESQRAEQAPTQNDDATSQQWQGFSPAPTHQLHAPAMKTNRVLFHPHSWPCSTPWQTDHIHIPTTSHWVQTPHVVPDTYSRHTWDPRDELLQHPTKPLLA